MTFRACSSPAPTPVKPQPAPALLGQESVHTTLLITHHIRKRPSAGPRTTHGPQSPPWWVHWQHPHKVTREKRKRKETNKKKLQQAIESQRKAKSKITWWRQVSDPLGKGNDSTHPRQNYAQAKSANHQTKARKTTKSSPCTHASSPRTNATPPRRMHARHHLKQSSCNSSALTGQIGHPHRSDWWTRSPSTWELHWSDRCPSPVRPMPPGKLTELKNSPKPPGNLLNVCSKPFQAQTSPPSLQCMNQAKMPKIQPRASQIDKNQHRMLHVSKWAS
jgi:hypothetical protein